MQDAETRRGRPGRRGGLVAVEIGLTRRAFFLNGSEIWFENLIVIRYLVLSYFTMESKKTVTEMEPQDKWLTITELSGYLKISSSKLYQMAQKGELPGSKIGTQWRFDRDRINAWMNEKMNTPNGRKAGAQHA